MDVFAGAETKAIEGKRIDITWEVLLWCGVLILATGLRLAQLGEVPLSPDEADNALSAWNVFHSQAADMPQGSLFTYATALVFFVFGATDVTARLLPALSGVVLVALPILVRRRIGRVSALACAFLLASSPTLVLYSRRADAIMLVACLSLAAVVISVRLAETGTMRWTVSLALVCGAMLVGGPTAYTAIVCLGCSCLAILEGSRRSRTSGTSVSVGRQFGVLAMICFLFLATGFLSNLHAIQDGVIDGLNTWLQSYSGIGSLNHWGNTLGFMVTYEPALCFLGIAGVITLSNGAAFDRFLTVWVVASLVFCSLVGGSLSEIVVLVVVPVAIVASCLAGRVLMGLRDKQIRNDAAFFAVFAVPLLWLTIFAVGHVTQAHPEVPVVVGVVPVVVLLITVGCFFWKMGIVRTRWAIAPVFLLVVGVLALHTSAVLQRGGFEMISGVATASDVRTLARDVADARYALVEAGRGAQIRVTPDLRSPLAWYLRELNVVFSDTGSTKDALLVTKLDSTAPQWQHVAQRYLFQEYGKATELKLGDWWRWFYYREQAGIVQKSSVVLYVKDSDSLAVQ